MEAKNNFSSLSDTYKKEKKKISRVTLVNRKKTEF